MIIFEFISDFAKYIGEDAISKTLFVGSHVAKLTKNKKAYVAINKKFYNRYKDAIEENANTPEKMMWNLM